MITPVMIAAVICSYLIGSIPTSVWIGRMFYGIDIRKEGSGNAGATNTMRVLGLKAGIPVLLIDVFKGWFAVYMGHFIHYGGLTFPDIIDYKIILAAAAVLGHVLPVYVGFKGGKGIATLLGVGLALFPHTALVAVGIFILSFIITKYVSLSSILAALSFPVTELLVFNHTQYPSMIILSFAVAFFVPITHKKNIRRLIKGEEPRFRLNKKNKN